MEGESRERERRMKSAKAYMDAAVYCLKYLAGTVNLRAGCMQLCPDRAQATS